MILQIKLIITAVVLAAIAGASWYVHRTIYQQGFKAAEAKQAKALTEAQKRYQEIADQWEVSKSEKRIVFEVIEKQVDKIVTEPFYVNSSCLDVRGVRLVNDAINGISSTKPHATLPEPNAP